MTILLEALILAIVLILAGLRLLAWFRENDSAVPQSTTLIETPLGTVAAAITGPQDGTPIMLVHGTAAWSGFWRDVSSHLADQGWRVIAVDLPPFGYSERDAKGRYDRVSQATRLAAVLRSSTDQAAVVVGHSFGAGAATELALRSPDQVRGLVLVDAALGKIDPTASSSLFQGALSPAIVGQPLTAATITNPWAIGPLLKGMIARKDAADDWIATLRQPMLRPATTSGYAEWLPELFTTNDDAWSRRGERLASITRPVAIIWGEADTVTPPAQGQELARLMRARSFTRLPGVGHIPHIEAPAAFLNALDQSVKSDKGE
jgi:pimeloyl-ACP methyl ester carboxylesterase